MQSKIVIIGSGFAGVWSAFSAQRLIKLRHQEETVEVIVIAPEPSLVIRPRLYEANASALAHPVGPLLENAGIKFIQGTVDAIHSDEHTVDARSASGVISSISYDRLILAAGSTVLRPQKIQGLEQYGFDVDSLDSAVKLESHLEHLASLQPSPARDTIVVCGGGFTGIELASELPGRLGHMKNLRVVLVENADEIGPVLGPGPRPVILEALESLGVEIKLGSAVTEVSVEGITLASGEYIETKTAVWTAGVRATALTQQIPAVKDALSRLHVDQDLRVPSSKHIFATGDAAHVLADNKDHCAFMSCQHAMLLGRVSGYNAAADLLNESTLPYSQAAYGCCLDLGAWGAVITQGWEREVKVTGATAKRVKTYINQELIYPPSDAETAIAMADPVTYPDGGVLFEQILTTVM
ncbi:hypothetical protein BP6252_10825 [Coleophoma cylindrospora]|uniref:FAD/NAD(P)-binding domain-containing protein n=1 Tax=Coleophoma cylindrospora TaxID=1849047 RepID=A0A3D8QNR3_9HELO|nr:hypothetical protein BP6252_10825 [Coleophoma cylindrospora]